MSADDSRIDSKQNSNDHGKVYSLKGVIVLGSFQSERGAVTKRPAHTHVWRPQPEEISSFDPHFKTESIIVRTQEGGLWRDV